MARETALAERVSRDLDLLRRHITVLKAVEENQPVGIIRLSELLGHPQHKVRYTLRVLEHEGLIRPSQKGAVVTKKVTKFHEELRDVLNEMKRVIETLERSL